MTPERQAELATELGLDEVPKLRYEEPDENPPLEHLVNFRKALALVDPIRTAAFEAYVPERCHIDSEMNAYAYVEGKSDALLIRTDIPPPLRPGKKVHAKISAATGIPYELSDRTFFIWLGKELEMRYISWGARRMAAPLIFGGRGDPKVPGARSFIGLILQFARNATDVPADWGAIVPPGTKIKPKNRRIALAIDSGRNLSGNEPEGT